MPPPPLAQRLENAPSGTDGLPQDRQQPRTPDDRQADDGRSQKGASVRGIDDRQRWTIARGHVRGTAKGMQELGCQGFIDASSRCFGLGLQLFVEQGTQFKRHVVALLARQPHRDIGDVGFDQVICVHCQTPFKSRTIASFMPCQDSVSFLSNFRPSAFSE